MYHQTDDSAEDRQHKAKQKKGQESGQETRVRKGLVVWLAVGEREKERRYGRSGSDSRFRILAPGKKRRRLRSGPLPAQPRPACRSSLPGTQSAASYSSSTPHAAGLERTPCSRAKARDSGHRAVGEKQDVLEELPDSRELLRKHQQGRQRAFEKEGTKL